MSTILVADDDVSIGTVLERALKRAGHTPRVTQKGKTLKEWVEKGAGDLVIMDVMMPDSNGLDIVGFIRRFRPELPVVVISAQSNFITAMKAAQAGAFEYLPKPFDLAELLHCIKNALPAQNGQTDVGKNKSGEKAEASPIQLPLIGSSVAMQEVYRSIARLSLSDMSVMLQGESSTGKGVVARVLHDYSKRADKPFISFNMSALSQENIERELFGFFYYENGVSVEKKGALSQAEEGTLYLDEVGDIPLHIQGRLLRALQHGTYTPLGGHQLCRVNVRIVSSTRYDIRKLIEQGGFREDLYYTLHVVPLRLPALRERGDDILELVRHFLHTGWQQGRYSRKCFTEQACAELKKYAWPGNIRELENFVDRVATLYPYSEIGKEIVLQELNQEGAVLGKNEHEEPSLVVSSSADNKKEETLNAVVTRRIEHYLNQLGEDSLNTNIYGLFMAEIEKPLITMVLHYTKGNQIKAAAILGLNRNTLRKKIRDLGIIVRRNML